MGMRVAKALLDSDQMLCTTAVWSKDLALPENALWHWLSIHTAMISSPFRTPFSAIVLSEWTITLLPRRVSLKVERPVEMQQRKGQIAASGCQPYAIASISSEAIWLSFLVKNCCRILCSGSWSVYVRQPSSSSSTAPILGGVDLHAKIISRAQTVTD